MSPGVWVKSAARSLGVHQRWYGAFLCGTPKRKLGKYVIRRVTTKKSSSDVLQVTDKAVVPCLNSQHPWIRYPSWGILAAWRMNRAPRAKIAQHMME